MFKLTHGGIFPKGNAMLILEQTGFSYTYKRIFLTLQLQSLCWRSLEVEASNQ